MLFHSLTFSFFCLIIQYTSGLKDQIQPSESISLRVTLFNGWNNIISMKPELKTLEWDILNPDQLINLEINKKRRSSINPDIHHSEVPSSGDIKLKLNQMISLSKT